MIKYRDISEAWYQSCRAAKHHGHEYIIDRGSFKGTKRKQLESLAFTVIWPWTRPLAVTYQGQDIVTQDQVEKYYRQYIIGDEINNSEQYTYGSRITPYLQKIIEMIDKTPATNQAIIQIARPEDLLLDDPPCLRSISFKVFKKRLNIAVYFRSWDLYSGLPSNLGGIQLLNEDIAEATGLTPGHLIAYSDGAHIYEYCFDRI